MAVLYTHRRKDNNQMFYIGIGKDKSRAYDKRHRSRYWKSITNKVAYDIEIIFEDITWEQACYAEKELIKIMGRKDQGKGSLINLTDGGDKTIGYRHTMETKRKISDANKGQIPWNKGKKLK